MSETLVSIVTSALGTVVSITVAILNNKRTIRQIKEQHQCEIDKLKEETNSKIKAYEESKKVDLIYGLVMSTMKDPKAVDRMITTLNKMENIEKYKSKQSK